jgi:hypothetical protein
VTFEETMRSLVACLVAALLVVGCDNSTTSPSTAALQLAQRETQWSALNLHSYTYDYTYQWFDIPLEARITVRNDSITSVVDRATGEPFDAQFAADWHTVDGLFGVARDLLGSKGARVVVQYDEQDGYPTSLSASWNNPGGGFSATVTNFQPQR